MNDSIDTILTRRWDQFANEVRSLLSSPACTLGEATPPKAPGIYVLIDEYTTITYAGIATNLCDRFHKHIFR